jgi:hypothetical protein
VAFAWPTGADGYRLRVELYIRGSDAAGTASIFAGLAEHREGIESAFGAPLEWEELEGRIGSRIASYYPGGAAVEDRENWEAYRSWTVDALARLRSALEPHLSGLSQAEA